MKVTVLFFGKVSDAFGPSREVEVPDGGCILGDLRAILARESATITAPGVRGSVDKQVVADDVPVRAGQEVAFFSLFSGG